MNTGKLIFSQTPSPCSPKSFLYTHKKSPANKIIIDCLHQCDLIIFTQAFTLFILHKMKISKIVPPYILGKLTNFIFACFFRL